MIRPTDKMSLLYLRVVQTDGDPMILISTAGRLHKKELVGFYGCQVGEEYSVDISKITILRGILYGPGNRREYTHITSGLYRNAEIHREAVDRIANYIEASRNSPNTEISLSERLREILAVTSPIYPQIPEFGPINVVQNHSQLLSNYENVRQQSLQMFRQHLQHHYPPQFQGQHMHLHYGPVQHRPHVYHQHQHQIREQSGNMLQVDVPIIANARIALPLDRINTAISSARRSITSIGVRGDECIICANENFARAIIAPCGHSDCCIGCAAKIFGSASARCPICRESISAISKPEICISE